MPRKLKVYGSNHYGFERRIVAATSMKAAAALLGQTYSRLREYGSETANKEEVELAMKEPGKVWTKSFKLGGVFKPLWDNV